MSDQINSSEISADQIGQHKSGPRFVRHAINVIAFLLIGYGIWGLLFDDKALEAAVDPVDGNEAVWNAYVDDGGLNSDSRFHGLRIDKATVTFTGDGGIADVSMVLDRGASAGDLRSALADVCDIEDSAWKVRTAPVLGGMADGKRCSVVYVEKNAEQWQLAYRVSASKASGPVSANDRACEESREAFVRRFARDSVSREQAEAMWIETHRTMKFADIDCREFARRSAGGNR